MRYYLIVGEASGDLHASRLMRSLKAEDSEAEFRFFGGDLMSAEGGTRVKHYRELAYMGFVPVLMHLRTILGNMEMCKRDITEWQPDVVVLVDYPGFNLSIAKYVHAHTHIPVYYYISPKIWAWKEWRIKSIRRDVDEMFSILPFEVDFYEGKHHYPIHYVGNPTAEEVRAYKAAHSESAADFYRANGLDADRPIIALLAGSRRQEVKDNLPAMIEAASAFGHEYQLVLAKAPSLDDEYYAPFIKGRDVKSVSNKTYALLSHSTAALVTSGTATLETALFGVPQTVCYKTPLPHIIYFTFKHVIKVPYISLVNLIAGRKVVSELFAKYFTIRRIQDDLRSILPGGTRRDEMLRGYADVAERLGQASAPDNAAQLMVELLRKRR